MKRIGRLWLLAVLALALLCMPQAAWAADTFTILVDGENANGKPTNWTAAALPPTCRWRWTPRGSGRAVR